MKVEEMFVDDGPLWSTGVTPDQAAPAAPSRASLPVRWTSSDAGEAQGDLGGGESDVAGEGDGAGQQVLPGEPEPDAVAKGWVVPPGGSRVEAIFVLAGTSLGIGRVERATSPVWLNLDDLVNLDAVGDPVDGLTEVEILMDDHRIIGAGWPDHFCDAVVQVLVDSAGRATATPGSPADTSHGAGQHGGAVPEPQVAVAARDDNSPAEPAPGPVSSPFSPAQVHIEEVSQLDAEQEAPDTVPGTSPAPDATPAAALELEDVVYLGGYPGQSKRRKKCVAGMSRAAVELSGPGDTELPGRLGRGPHHRGAERR